MDIDVRITNNLTKRGLEIFNLLLKYYDGKSIMDSLFISKPTLKTHKRNLYKKLNCKNSVQLRQKYLKINPKDD